MAPPSGIDGAMTLARKLGVLIIALVLPTKIFAAQSPNATRARSDELVKQAESDISKAGQSSPFDGQLINRAIDELHHALKIDSHNDSAYVDLGFCYAALRDASTAEDMYRTATLINPSPANFKELADIYLRVGNAESALEAANAGLVKDPKNAKLYNAKGLALSDLQRTDEAEAAFRQAVRFDPELKVAQQNLDALTGRLRKSGGAATSGRPAGLPE